MAEINLITWTAFVHKYLVDVLDTSHPTTFSFLV